MARATKPTNNHCRLYVLSGIVSILVLLAFRPGAVVVWPDEYPRQSYLQMCSKYKVAEPPPLRPSVEELGQHLSAQMRRTPRIELLQNKTFIDTVSRFSIEERERLALDGRNIAIYLGNEVKAVQKAEEEAVLRAAPLPDLSLLNGLNLGAGSRPVDPSMTLVEGRRGTPVGASHEIRDLKATANNTILSWAQNLPFKSNTIDYIVSLHNLEHLHDPVQAVLHYLDVLKPGGGIGIVVPHWEYAWDARLDDGQWGHRWNSCPEVVCEMFNRYWRHIAELEHLNTYAYRLSFDFVLRKKGQFVPFNQSHPGYPTGTAAYCKGMFIGPHDARPAPDVVC